MDLLDLLRKVAEDAFKALSVVILFVKDSDARGVNDGEKFLPNSKGVSCRLLMISMSDVFLTGMSRLVSASVAKKTSMVWVPRAEKVVFTLSPSQSVSHKWVTILPAQNQ